MWRLRASVRDGRRFCLAGDSTKRYSAKELTKLLRELAAEAHTITDDGAVVTKGEALVSLLWQQALGYTERRVNDEGAVEETIHRGAPWAQQLIYDRMEGRVPQAVADDETRLTAAKQVRELAKNRLNDLAQKITETGGRPDLVRQGPPTLPKRKSDAK